MEAVKNEKRRLNITFPAELADSLEELVPRGQRNRFVVEATEKALRHERLVKALDESAGAWSDEEYPELATADDIERFVRNLRESSPARTWDEMLEDE